MNQFPVSKQGADTLERCELLLNAAHALHANGQETEETLRTVAGMAQQLSVPSKMFIEWGALTLQAEDPDGMPVVVHMQAVPTSVAMNRVAAIYLALGMGGEPLAIRTALDAIQLAEHTKPAPLWLFALACAAGAAALSLIFGAVHKEAIGMIAAGAATGAFVRRYVGHLGGGAIVQALIASLLAGLVGALAVRLHISSELRLVAVCQCMILVPGPHILNGTLDLTYLRIPLGLSRLVFACLILVAICIGVLLGLHLGGSDLPVDAPGRHVALWLDVSAAGVAAASYSIYFSTPLSMLGWPIIIGMLAHAARWWVMSNYGFGAASAAGLACFIVAMVLVPVASRRKLPFAAIGFASVVSLIPGIFIFRTSSGLVALYQHLSSVTPGVLVQTLADATTAMAIVLWMGMGLIIPKRFYGALPTSSSKVGTTRA